MRWADLFADLDGQFDQLREREEDAAVVEQTRREFAGVTMVERLAGAMGGSVTLRLAGNRTVTGTLRRLGPDWVMLAESTSTETIVATIAIAAVEGLTSTTGRPLGVVDSRYDFRLVLRAVARDRSPVIVHTTFDTEMSGTIDRVGADFVEIAAHSAWEVRRSTAVRTVVLIPLAAMLSVRAVPLG